MTERTPSDDEYSDDEPVCWAEHTPGNRLRCGLGVDHDGGHYFNTWEG